MRKKISILLLTTFLVTGIKAIHKDSVIYNFKAGVISPYCFKYNTYYEIAIPNNGTHSWPFNSGFSIGLDASRKNFSCEFSFDHSSFRKITHFKFNDSLVDVIDIPYHLTQLRLFPKYRIIHSSNSSLNIGCGFAMARPSSAYSTNNPNRRYYLYLGDGICCNIEYIFKIPKRRLGLSVSITYEKLDNNPVLGPSASKYDYGQGLHVPIYMASLGVTYGLDWDKKQ